MSNIPEFIFIVPYRDRASQLEVFLEVRFPEKSINLLLMDVQGHELQVIRSINFKKQKIDYIYFEDENPTSKNSIQIKNLFNQVS